MEEYLKYQNNPFDQLRGMSEYLQTTRDSPRAGRTTPRGSPPVQTPMSVASSSSSQPSTPRSAKQASKTALPFTIRPVQPGDLPEITAIVNWYIKNTIVNFSLLPNLPNYYEGIYTSCLKTKLPFLVAVPNPIDPPEPVYINPSLLQSQPGSPSPATPGPGTPNMNTMSISTPQPQSPSNYFTTSSSTDPPHAPQTPPPRQQQQPPPANILGFALVAPYNPSKIGYMHTLELSIYLSPSAPKSAGIGTHLLKTLFTQLEDPNADFKSFAEIHSGNKAGVSYRPKEVLAVMSVNVDRRVDESLKRFYLKNGFVETGFLSGVGWKFGSPQDVRYMQRGVNEFHMPKVGWDGRFF